MMTCFRSFATLGAFLVTACTGFAGPMVSITSPANLNNISVGQMVTFNVMLSGLNPGDQLFFLAATVDYTDGRFSAPLAVNPGPIVPDNTGFIGSVLPPNSVDGFYDELFAPGNVITTNGIFYSFQMTAATAGSGQLGFSFLASDGIDAGSAPLDFVTWNGQPVEFAITQAVPEPSTLLLASVGTCAALGIRQLRRRAKTP